MRALVIALCLRMSLRSTKCCTDNRAAQWGSIDEHICGADSARK